MSVERVKKYLTGYGLDGGIMEFDQSSATVELAAKALGVEPARIAKSISMEGKDQAVLIVAAGDVKIDNGKYKAAFANKAKMMSPERTLEATGYAVGGVCPFDMDGRPVTVYCDESLKRFTTVFPACGSSNSAIEMTCDSLFEVSKSVGWVDVCKRREA